MFLSFAKETGNASKDFSLRYDWVRGPAFAGVSHSAGRGQINDREKQIREHQEEQVRSRSEPFDAKRQEEKEITAAQRHPRCVPPWTRIAIAC